MVRPVGVEPTTYGLEVRCSIQLSYRRKCIEIIATIHFFFDTLLSPKNPPLMLSETSYDSRTNLFSLIQGISVLN